MTQNVPVNDRLFTNPYLYNNFMFSSMPLVIIQEVIRNYITASPVHKQLPEQNLAFPKINEIQFSDPHPIFIITKTALSEVLSPLARLFCYVLSTSR